MPQLVDRRHAPTGRYARVLRVMHLLLIVCAIPLFGHTSPAHAEPTTVRVALVQSASDAPFFIAEKKGYFAQEDIRVNFMVLRDMIAPLGTGQLDVGGTSTSAGLFNAVARGIDIKIVADKGSTPVGYDYQPILVRKDLVTSGKVKGFEDLKGLNVAAFNKGSASMSTLNEALTKVRLKLSDVNLIYMPFPQHVLALKNRAVDASITTEPSATEAITSGAAVRLTAADIYPDHQLAVVLYSGDFVKKNPEVARKFMRAYIRGARDYNDALKDGKLAGPRADEVIAILNQYTAIKDPEIFRRMTPNGVDPNGRLNMASLRKDLQFYKDQGLIEGTVSVEQAVDNSFVEMAVKDLGIYARRSK